MHLRDSCIHITGDIPEWIARHAGLPRTSSGKALIKMVKNSGGAKDIFLYADIKMHQNNIIIKITAHNYLS